MTITVGMRELARNSNILDGYDYIDVEDKKTHKYKGLFVSPKYADEIKDFLKARADKDIQKQLDGVARFAGSNEVEDRYKDLEGKELMIEVSKAKSGI